MNKLAVIASAFLLATIGLADISPATAGKVKIIQCNGCSTTEMSFEDYMRMKGGTVVRKKKRRAVASIQNQGGRGWKQISTISLRFKGGTYQGKDVNGDVQSMTCSRTKQFINTADGSGRCFYCTFDDGTRITIVVGADSEWGATPTGWWAGHHN